MERYSNFTAEEFLNDPCFREWLVGTGEETDQFWKEFLLRFPEKQKTVLDARILFKALARSQSSATAEQGERMWDNIRVHTEAVSQTIANRRPLYRFWPLRRLMAAASILLFLGLGSWYLMQSKFLNKAETYADQVASSESPLIEKFNQGNKPIELLLPDGSQVLLHPSARISYEAGFSAGQRTVYLTGKAHFKVVKDGTRPFRVFANNLVTQVVGTSFTVDSPSATALATVKVESGKVKVYTLESYEKNTEGNEAAMATLTPNQQVTYDPVRALLTRGFVEAPALLNVPETYPDFYFDNTAVASVFKTLEESYGVTIRYETSTIQDCSVTAPLGNEPLFRKLDIICQTIGATYEVWGTEIVVTGPGCGL